MPRAAYVELSRFLVGRHRRDLLTPLASARASMARTAILIDAARRHDDAAAVVRLKIESMKQRAAAERAVFRIIECIGEESDGGDLVAALMGDGGELLADRLLDGE